MPIAKGFEEPRELPTSVTFSQPWNLVARALNAVAGTKDPTGQAMGLAQPMGGVVVPIKKFSRATEPALGEQVAGWLKQYMPKVHKVLQETPRLYFTKRPPLGYGGTFSPVGKDIELPTYRQAMKEAGVKPPPGQPSFVIDIGQKIDDWVNPIAVTAHEGTHAWGAERAMQDLERRVQAPQPFQYMKEAMETGGLHEPVTSDPKRLAEVLRYVADVDPSLVSYFLYRSTGGSPRVALGELVNEATARKFLRQGAGGKFLEPWTDIIPRSRTVGSRPGELEAQLPKWNDLVNRVLKSLGQQR